MEKRNLFTSSLFLIVIVLSLTGCGKKGVIGVDTKKCEARAKTLTDALTAYASSQTIENCRAYKAALQDYVNEGTGCGFGTADVTAARQAIEALTCQ